MTQSQQRERVVFIVDSIDSVANDRESAVAPEANASELTLGQPEPGAMIDAPTHRSTIWDRLVAWVNRPPREKKKHYPQRFATEFDASIVDRERRRL